MLSKSTFRYIDKAFAVSNKLWLIPLYWNADSRQLGLNISKNHLFFYIIVLTYFSCDCLYGSVIVYYMVRDLSTTGNFVKTMQVSIHWFTRLATLFCHFFLLKYSEEISHYFNKFLQFHQQFESKILSNTYFEICNTNSCYNNLSKKLKCFRALSSSN